MLGKHEFTRHIGRSDGHVPRFVSPIEMEEGNVFSSTVTSANERNCSRNVREIIQKKKTAKS